jgi:hypothetical protein
MISIIGLGDCGCNIAEKFSAYPQYKVYYVNTQEDYGATGKFFEMPTQSHPEKYEEKCPDLGEFFNDVDDDILFIVGGSGYISGCSLRLLRCLEDKRINVLYIQPDREFLSETKTLLEKCSFQIYQEYARSAVFEKIFLFKNSNLESLIDNLTVTEFYDKINEYVVAAVHMVNVFDNTKPVMSSFSGLSSTSRICAFGTFDLRSGEEKMFFPLDNIREKRYYIGVSKKTLETDASLLSQIKKHVKPASENIKSSFSIYSTDYEENFAYVLCYTPEIQTKNHARIE